MNTYQRPNENNKIAAVKYSDQDTMKDLKFKKELSGQGGANCIICESMKEY